MYEMNGARVGAHEAIETTTITAGELTWDVGTSGPWDGRPLLLLHGFPEYWRTWATVMPALASQGFRVHAAALPGYGRTSPPDAYDIDTVASHIADLCDEISGGGRCDIVGHDWGGILAAAVASLHAGGVRSVTLACCAHPAVVAAGRRDPRQVLRSLYIGMFQIPGIEHLLARPALLERLSPGTSEIETAEEMTRALAYYRANLRPWALRRSAAGAIEVPGLVVHARGDVAITETIMRATADHVRDLRGFEVLDCGHFIHRECPDQLLAVLLPFLREVE
ncbi:MAG: alpha/beta hydrolase [Actinomycetota bacterium]|nr:alpha/beta hydrolase [Actinomycetota bacterium]